MRTCNAQADARRARALAPELAQAHLALSFMSDNTLNFPQADAAYARALKLAPGINLDPNFKPAYGPRAGLRQAGTSCGRPGQVDGADGIGR